MKSKFIVLIATGIIIGVSVIFIFFGINFPLTILNENQILYLYSTSSQVLSAIYGLTLTGFIFFRNELSREEVEDETLVEAVQSLKKRYSELLMFITILSIISILLCNLVMSIETIESVKLKVILINVTQSFFITNLLVIVYFIFDVISPKRIEKESKNIQLRVDRLFSDSDFGSLEDFLKNYNQIEYILQKYGSAYQSDDSVINRNNVKRISNVRLAEIIYKAEKIDFELYSSIRDLITLRNSIIHGAEPAVSKNIVEISREVLIQLGNALHVQVN